MRRSLVALAACLGVALASCAGAPRVPVARVRVVCNVPDAGLVVDDRLVGRVAALPPGGAVVRAGFRRIEVRHPDHYSHYAELDLREGETAVVAAELHPLLE